MENNTTKAHFENNEGYPANIYLFKVTIETPE